MGFECISGRELYEWKDVQKFLCAHLTDSGFYTICTNLKSETQHESEIEEENKIREKILIKVVDNSDGGDFWKSIKSLLNPIIYSFWSQWSTNNVCFSTKYNDIQYHVEIERIVRYETFSFYKTAAQEARPWIKLTAYEIAQKAWLDVLFHIRKRYLFRTYLADFLVPIVRSRENVIRFITPIIPIRDFYHARRCFQDGETYCLNPCPCFENYNTASKEVKYLKEIAFNSCFDVECVENDFNPLCYTFQAFQYACALNIHIFIHNIPSVRVCCSTVCVVPITDTEQVQPSSYVNDFTLTDFTLCLRCAGFNCKSDNNCVTENIRQQQQHVYYEYMKFNTAEECIQYIKPRKYLWCRDCLKCVFLACQL